MCMAKPRHIYNKESRATIDILMLPHDVMVDNLKIGDIQQMVFDKEELEKVKYNNISSPTASYNPYADYSDSDSESELELEPSYGTAGFYNNEKSDLLPLPVTMKKPTKEKVTVVSKILLVLIGLMVMSLIIHFTSDYTMLKMNGMEVNESSVEEVEYKYTEKLDQLYKDFHI